MMDGAVTGSVDETGTLQASDKTTDGEGPLDDARDDADGDDCCRVSLTWDNSRDILSGESMMEGTLMESADETGACLDDARDDADGDDCCRVSLTWDNSRDISRGESIIDGAVTDSVEETGALHDFDRKDGEGLLDDARDDAGCDDCCRVSFTWDNSRESSSGESRMERAVDETGSHATGPDRLDDEGFDDRFLDDEEAESAGVE
jgi:hypothetical protein